MTDQLPLWAQEPKPKSREEAASPEQEPDPYPSLEQELHYAFEWARKHHWCELCYVGYDGQRGTSEHIGPGKDKWDEWWAHPSLYDARKAAFFARQWESLETQPGTAAGEFIVDVPVGLHCIDLHWGRKRLLELGEECDYWPIHWRVGGKQDVLLLGLPCWERRTHEATAQWLTDAIRAVELYIKLSQTSITCASCKKPTYFPGLTLEQVRERFKDSTCGMCLKRMFIREGQERYEKEKNI